MLLSTLLLVLIFAISCPAWTTVDGPLHHCQKRFINTVPFLWTLGHCSRRGFLSNTPLNGYGCFCGRSINQGTQMDDLERRCALHDASLEESLSSELLSARRTRSELRVVLSLRRYTLSCDPSWTLTPINLVHRRGIEAGRVTNELSTTEPFYAENDYRSRSMRLARRELGGVVHLGSSMELPSPLRCELVDRALPHICSTAAKHVLFCI
uniref:Phospholipase A(2) n=1 Tax=Steinernema glaseri TaxID=37863 RepID=A0A1I7Z8K5_9BILA